MERMRDHEKQLALVGREMLTPAAAGTLGTAGVGVAERPALGLRASLSSHSMN